MMMMKVLCCTLLDWFPQESSLSGATKIKYEEMFLFTPCDIYIMEGILLADSLMVPCPISKIVSPCIVQPWIWLFLHFLDLGS